MPPKGLLGNDHFYCGKCKHSKRHEYNVLGQTLCPDCPQGICTDPAEADPLHITMTLASSGLGFLNQMSKDQLISEIVTAECVRLQTFEIDSLKRMVIMLRMQGVRDRLLTEAGFSNDDGPEGWFS